MPDKEISVKVKTSNRRQKQLDIESQKNSQKYRSNI